jgi:uncharacterized membrane protein
VVAACGQLTAGGLMLAPFAVASSVQSGLDLDLRILGSVVLLGAVGTGAAYVLNYAIVREVGATKASLVTYLIPAVAVAVGVVVLREPFHLSLVAGAVLIIGGIAIVHDRLRWPPLPRPPATAATGLVAVALLGAGALVACGGTGGSDEGCGPIRREALDPSYLVHVLPDGPQVEYRSDPPTSGPHQPGPAIDGVSDAPLSRPVQVGLLEQGDVLIQHRPDLPEPEVEALVGLAGESVVVAPNADLPDPIVATAWLHKVSCGTVDVSALQDFVDARRGRGPEH